MKAIALTAAAVTATLGSPQVLAEDAVARLDSTQGAVMISTSTGYKRAYGGMDLFVGDRLMVLEGSSGVISYPDGCSARVGENRIITVENRSICRGSNAQDTAFSDYDRGPIGGTASNPHLLAGVAVAAITIPFALDNNDDSAPVSGE